MGSISMGQAIKEIITRFGNNVFYDARRFCALFDDIAPNLSLESKIIHRVIDERLLLMFLALEESEIDVQPIQIKRIENILLDEYGLSPKWAVVLICGFCDAFDIDYQTNLVVDEEQYEEENYETPTMETESVYNGDNSAVVAPLLRRTQLFLEDGEFEKAEEYCEKVLDFDPENAQAYLYRLMSEEEVRKEQELKNCSESFNDSDSYKKAIRFGDTSLISRLKSYIEYINDRNYKENCETIYQTGLKKMKFAKTESDYLEAAECFSQILEWKDSKIQYASCKEKAVDCQKLEIYNQAVQLEGGWVLSNYERALNLYLSIKGWRDVDTRIEKCKKKIEEIKKKDAEEKRKDEELTRKRLKKEKSKKVAKTIIVLILIIAAISGIVFGIKSCSDNQAVITEKIKSELPGKTMTSVYSQMESGFWIHYYYYKLVFKDDNTADYYYLTTVGEAGADDEYTFEGNYPYTLTNSFGNYKISVAGQTYDLILSDDNEPKKIKINR